MKDANGVWVNMKFVNRVEVSEYRSLWILVDKFVKNFEYKLVSSN